MLLNIQSKEILKSTNIIAYETYAEVLPLPVCRFKKLRFMGEIPCPHHLSDLRSGLESNTNSGIIYLWFPNIQPIRLSINLERRPLLASCPELTSFSLILISDADEVIDNKHIICKSPVKKNSIDVA